MILIQVKTLVSLLQRDLKNDTVFLQPNFILNVQPEHWFGYPELRNENVIHIKEISFNRFVCVVAIVSR